MGKVVKLSEYRKRKAKAEREKQADTKRRLHGRTTAERARDELQKKRLTRAVDGARLEPPAQITETSADPGDGDGSGDKPKGDDTDGD